MQPIAPDMEMLNLPEGSVAVVFAADQPEYAPLPAVRTMDGRVVTQWTLTDMELAAVFQGRPITLVLHTFNSPLQPIQLAVGGIDLR